jgi:hypothetical protein
MVAKLFAAEENSDWGISQDMISALVIRPVVLEQPMGQTHAPCKSCAHKPHPHVLLLARRYTPHQTLRCLRKASEKHYSPLHGSTARFE